MTIELVQNDIFPAPFNEDSYRATFEESRTMDTHLDAVQDLNANITDVEHLDATFGEVTVIQSTDVPTYTGATTVTPSDSIQVLSTSGKYVPTNITVNPIPSNYGRIVWNGTYITIV